MSDLVVPVSSLDRYIDMRLRGDPFLSGVWIEGEVNGPHVARGTCYFSLKDDGGSLECVVFRFEQTDFGSILLDGTKIQVQGQFSFYAASGRLSLLVRQARVVGQGEQYQRMLELGKKLEAQGCFAQSRKRPLPTYPHKIAIITSRDGAALHDILKISSARNPTIKRVLYPVAVQGRDAARTVAMALDKASQDPEIDVIIVSRGGGSTSDLSAFNDPQVVYAVTRANAPVISAVGHENDVTFCDLAADVRASTPSNAAELAVPESIVIARQIDTYRQQIERRMQTIVESCAAEIDAQRSILASRGIRFRVGQARTQVELFRRSSEARLKGLIAKWRGNANQERAQVDMFRQGSKARIENVISEKRGELGACVAELKALDPRSIVSSGYAVVLRDGVRIYRASQLQVGDKLELMFVDGTVPATVAGPVLKGDSADE